MNKTNKPLKILCLTPFNNDMITPETLMAKLLAERGHEVYLEYTGYDINKCIINRGHTYNKPDVIFGMMEYSLPTAVIYKKLLNIPLYGHIECIPPWRTGLNSKEEYGFDYPEVSEEIDYQKSIALYKNIVDSFLECDSTTISGKAWQYTFKPFTNKKFDVKYYTYFPKHYEQYRGNYETKNQICTIARFTPIKRVHHVIQALALISKDIRPMYKIIGYGNEQKYLEELAKKLDVEVDFVGSGKDGEKFEIIQESMFMVQIFSGMPVLEAGFFSKHTVSYNTSHMMETYGDMCSWTEENNIIKLSEKIKELCLDKEKTIELGKKSNYVLLNNKSNILDPESYVKVFEYQLNKAMEKKK